MALPTAPRLSGDDSVHHEKETVFQIDNKSKVVKENIINEGHADTTAQLYKGVGEFTANDLLNNSYKKYSHLDDIVASLTEYIQGTFSDQQQTESIVEARTEGGDKFDDMRDLIDRMILTKIATERYKSNDKKVLVARVINEVLGLGPIDPLWRDPRITEIMVNGPYSVSVEIEGKLIKVPGARFRDADHLLNLCQQILLPINRAVNTSNPLEDGRLPDKSRVNIVHQSIAPDGPFLTIRRHRKEIWTIKELIQRKALAEEVAVDLAFWIHSGCSTVVIGGTGSGKALALTTRIPTPTGFTTMGELTVGDEVFTEEGIATKITAIFDQGIRPTFVVKFSDGTEVIADAEHNWLTSTRAARRSFARGNKAECKRTVFGTTEEIRELKTWRNDVANSDVKTLSVKDVAEKFPRLRHVARYATDGLTFNVVSTRESRRYDALTYLTAIIEKCSKVINDQQHKRTVKSVVTTQEIFDSLKTSTGHTNHAIQLSLPVKYAVRTLEVNPYDYGHRAAEESSVIAEEYLISSIEQRKDLLAGILDAVAVPSRASASIELTTTSAPFAASVRQLIHSLGYQSVERNRGLSADSLGSYSVSFSSGEDVFKDVHKSDIHQKASKRNDSRNHLRYIVDVIPHGEEETRCITVDNDSHLYLCTDAFIVTHNTTILNAISGLIPEAARVITIEDNLELQLHPQRMIAAMEARPPSASGQGAVTIRHLVRNALRMRPDRIVVGEVRDAAAFDMLQAMNTGHDGSLTTFHANGADEAIPRLESMVMQSGELDPNGVKSLIAGAIDLIVVVSRYPEDGSRRISGVFEVPSRVVMQDGLQSLYPIPLWVFVQDGIGEDGKIFGHYEKKNEISENTANKKRLHQVHKFTAEEVYQMSDLGQHNDEDN